MACLGGGLCSPIQFVLPHRVAMTHAKLSTVTVIDIALSSNLQSWLYLELLSNGNSYFRAEVTDDLRPVWAAVSQRKHALCFLSSLWQKQAYLRRNSRHDVGFVYELCVALYWGKTRARVSLYIIALLRTIAVKISAAEFLTVNNRLSIQKFNESACPWPCSPRKGRSLTLPGIFFHVSSFYELSKWTCGPERDRRTDRRTDRQTDRQRSERSPFRDGHIIVIY